MTVETKTTRSLKTTAPLLRQQTQKATTVNVLVGRTYSLDITIEVSSDPCGTPIDWISVEMKVSIFGAEEYIVFCRRARMTAFAFSS
jgi:hypothetical protein